MRDAYWRRFRRCQGPQGELEQVNVTFCTGSARQRTKRRCSAELASFLATLTPGLRLACCETAMEGAEAHRAGCAMLGSCEPVCRRLHKDHEWL